MTSATLKNQRDELVAMLVQRWEHYPMFPAGVDLTMAGADAIDTLIAALEGAEATGDSEPIDYLGGAILRDQLETYPDSELDAWILVVECHMDAEPNGSRYRVVVSENTSPAHSIGLLSVGDQITRDGGSLQS